MTKDGVNSNAGKTNAKYFIDWNIPKMYKLKSVPAEIKPKTITKVNP